MHKRGSYFYVIDAFVAGAIIVFTLMYLTMVTVNTSSGNDFFGAEKILRFLKTDARDYASPTMTQIQNSSGAISEHMSLLMLMTKLHYLNQTQNEIYGEYLINLSTEIFVAVSRPEQGVRFVLGDALLYEKNPEAEPRSELHLIAKGLTFYQVNETYIHGPFTANVEVWR